jgi:hypothetical protein
MLSRALTGVFVLGGAAVAAVSLYWLTVVAFGLDYRSVFEGGLITAGLIGVAYLTDVLPGPNN